jgi:hypothetical protein
VTFKVLATWAAVNDRAVKFLSTAVDNFGQDPQFQRYFLLWIKLSTGGNQWFSTD